MRWDKKGNNMYGNTMNRNNVNRGAAGGGIARVILFNPPEGEAGRALKKALRRAKVDVIVPDPMEYGAALGQFAGVRGLPAPELPEDIQEKAMTALSLRPTYPQLPDTLIVFAFLEGEAFDRALEAVRTCGAGPFPYKAVLTPTNMTWSVYACFREICAEHDQMNS